MILLASEVTKRAAKIRVLLRPIARAAAGPATETVHSGGLWIIGTRDEAQVTSNYRDWRFATPIARHHAMYFEAWKQIDSKRYRWQSAYLNIYKRTAGGNEEEVICLHCDPAEPAAAAHSRYKRGPHLHVSAAGDPLKHAHLALHVEHVDEMLQKCQSIHDYLASGIQMIRDEVLDLIEASKNALGDDAEASL